MLYQIKEAYNDIEKIRELFHEYTNSLEIDLSFQNYEKELENLPGKYSLPKGRLYIIYAENKAVGCIGLRHLKDKDCEIKRLYIKPEHRSNGLGKRLTKKVISEAKNIGYEKIFLDTLSSLERAVKMYKNIGFKEVPSYYDNPYTNVIYFCMEL